MKKKFDERQRLEWSAIVVVYLVVLMFAVHVCAGFAGAF